MKAVRSYAGKQLFDIIMAGVALIALSPLMALIGLISLVVLGRPVIFTQVRPGAFERHFKLYKFCSMISKYDSKGNLLPDSERLTCYGAFLRKTSLDELPELINVIKGEMSLVGPRPLLVQYQSYFRPRERLRFSVRPGITGLAQVSGRNFVGWDQRLEFDARYVETISFANDMKILFRTVGVLFCRRGVAPDVDKVETWLDAERRNEVIS